MTHTRDAISLRGDRRVFHSAVLAALTLGAMLLCLLAVHSAGTGHGLGHGPGHSLSAGPATTAATTAAGVATVAMTAAVTATAMTAGAHSATAHTAASVGAISSADTNAMTGPAALSMICSLLLVLGGLILLSRRPSACRRLLDAGGFIVDSFREIPLHLHRPSLTLLSISRI
ncbi:hypothetical protein E3T23_05410 [Cryobacterium cheniae]|uniref:Uncharacterized protein n=1 Tax=Cryobacterium cheniae TaxID=1259262 RepID=A0A4R8XSA7_9MICO|nr:hypothetical protein [Cryobacterium cheniae]TFC81981.1 hypothetical protein E3T23_05410 [Cryobacterium cheniae]